VSSILQQDNILSIRSHGTFSKTDHILGHKTNLNKCKKIEISPCILPDNNAIKLELKNNRKYSNS
jgi:hypothetical protein